LWVFLFIED